MRMLANRPCSQTERDRIMRHVIAGVWAMVNGRASRDNWNACADLTNLIEALADMGKINGELVAGHVLRAIDGLVHANRSINAGQPGRADDAGCIALCALAIEYDKALARFSAETMEAARRLCISRIARQVTDPSISVVVCA